jgi:hypothetical protein
MNYFLLTKRQELEVFGVFSHSLEAKPEGGRKVGLNCR